ncbi:MAG: hypothetical protein CMO80_06860 [Verrucomicrobiales bacterium]|nr:hypothetical protein [Verrucomicrobiales bacterium]|tara:strand:+ start:144 stop:668 length:525 start_codon:yes stop_codon:yes gene_type:complete
MKAIFPLAAFALIANTTTGAESKRPSLPNNEVKTLAGKAWRIADQKGKVVVLDFWSLNCRPCLAMVPRTRRLNGDWQERKDIVLLGVPTDDNLIQIRRHVKRNRMNWSQLVGQKGSAMSALAAPLGVKVMPTPNFWIIDPDGGIVASTADAEKARKVAEAVARLLREKSNAHPN